MCLSVSLTVGFSLIFLVMSVIFPARDITQEVELWIEVAFVPEIWPDTAVGWGSLSSWCWFQSSQVYCSSHLVVRPAEVPLFEPLAEEMPRGRERKQLQMLRCEYRCFSIFISMYIQYIFVCLGIFRKVLWAYRCLYRDNMTINWGQKALIPIPLPFGLQHLWPV